MERINLLSVDIWTTTLDLPHALGREVHHEVFSGGRPVPGSYSEEHGTHTYYEDLVLKDSSLMQEVKDQIAYTSSEILQREYEVSAMWGLILHRGESVQPHSHKSNHQLNPHEYYSVAYYPTASFKDAELIFNIPFGGSQETVRSIQPESGMMVLFPSYLTHYTNRQTGNTRVVVSANVEPVNPSESTDQDWSAYNFWK